MSSISQLAPKPDGASHGRLLEAKELMQQALDLLDEAEAPPEFGARLKSALDALEAHASSGDQASA